MPIFIDYGPAGGKIPSATTQDQLFMASKSLTWVDWIENGEACRAWDVESETRLQQGSFPLIKLSTPPKPDRPGRIVELKAPKRPW
jgi:hypothetical protein